MKTKLLPIWIALIALTVFGLILISSCKKEDIEIETNDFAFGIEAYPNIDGDTMTIVLDDEPIVVELINGEYIYQGDIIIALDDQKSTKGAAIVSSRRKWPNGIVYFKINNNFPDKQRVIRAIERIESKTDIQFIERTNEINYVEFVRHKGNSSWLGMIGVRQNIRISDGAGVHIVIHEICHALGMIHEHSRKDRDKYVQILWENIRPLKQHNFWKRRRSINTEKFDYKSIMLYPSFAFSKEGLPTIITDDDDAISKNLFLSDGDIEMIRQMYSTGTTTEGNIYFLSDESENNNIYLGELSGNQIVNIQQITNYTGDNSVLAYDVCKSSGRIAYVVTQDGRRGNIYTLETIYSNSVLLPNQPSSRVGPLVKWSPDGNSLLFSIGGNQYYHHLQTATMNLDGSNYQIIINKNQPLNRACHKNTILWLDEGMYLGITPQWAAHASDHDLWFRNPSGSFTRLTNTSGIGERHAFMNPEGTKLVFGTLDNSQRQGIRFMSKSGGTQTEIIPHSNNYSCWPNGWLDDETIIYTYRANITGTKFDLYLINLDGSNARNISNMKNANITNAILK